MLERPPTNGISERIRTYVPQSSVVGMLLEHEERYTIVHSTQVGLMQHDLYSWEVLRDHFVYLDTVTGSSKFIDSTLKDWVAGMNREERATFFDTLYQLLAGTQAKTVGELSGDWLHSAGAVLQSLKNVDEDTRRLMGQVMGGLFRSARENLRPARPGARAGSGVWSRVPLSPRGSGAVAARSPVAAGKGGSLPGRGRRPSLSRGPEEWGRCPSPFVGGAKGKVLPKADGSLRPFRLRAAPPVIWQPTRPLRPFPLFRREDLHTTHPRGRSR